jgi:uncharacterized damage-inducible protein DinB
MSSPVDRLAAHYLEDVRKSYRAYKELGENAFAQLRDEDFSRKPDPESNSIAIVVKHMAGNMRSRWTDFLTSDGEKPDRHRDQEFEEAATPTRVQVMDWWRNGWQITFHALEALRPEDLSRTVTIGGKPHTVLQAIQRQLAHYAYHCGQIVYLAKHFRSGEWKSLSEPKPGQEKYTGRK